MSFIRVGDLKEHRTEGKYSIHAYATKNGERSLVETGGCYVRQAVYQNDYIITEQIDDTHIKLSLHTNQTYEMVTFPTWNEENNQDDIVWYPGTLESDGLWTCIVDLKRHTGNGMLIVHAYEIREQENVFLDGINVNIN